MIYCVRRLQVFRRGYKTAKGTAYDLGSIKGIQPGHPIRFIGTAKQKGGEFGVQPGGGDALFPARLTVAAMLTSSAVGSARVCQKKRSKKRSEEPRAIRHALLTQAGRGPLPC